jgi:hypothetical protein
MIHDFSDFECKSDRFLQNKNRKLRKLRIIVQDLLCHIMYWTKSSANLDMEYGLSLSKEILATVIITPGNSADTLSMDY